MNIKQEMKLSEPLAQIKKDKKAAKDLMVCPKKKKRKQRSPAKVQFQICFQKSHFVYFLTCRGVKAIRLKEILLFVSVVVDSQPQ